MRMGRSRWVGIALIVLAACGGGSERATSRSNVTSSAPQGASGLEWTRLLTELGLRDPTTETWRTLFATGFEDDADLAGFYVTPESPLTRHESVTGEERHSGEWAHHGWLTGEAGAEPVDGPNHRGYPTIQLHKTVGPCGSPCLVDSWVRLDDVVLAAGEWFSFATFSTDASDRWSRVVTVNVGYEGWLHLFHVPTQGAGERAFQRTDLPFPLGKWVRVTTLLDVDAAGGAAAVWQDGVLMSAARIADGDGDVDQMHFGLYAPPTLSQGSVWNDDIVVMTGA